MHLYVHTRVVVDWEVLDTVGPRVVIVVGEIKLVAGHYQVATRPPRLKKMIGLIFFHFSQPTLKRATHLRVFLAIWTVMF